MTTTYTTSRNETLTMKRLQNDMQAILLDGKQIAVAIKADGEIILDHIKTTDSNDGTVFPNKPNGKPIKTWKDTFTYMIEWIEEI